MNRHEGVVNCNNNDTTKIEVAVNNRVLGNSVWQHLMFGKFSKVRQMTLFVTSLEIPVGERY